MFTANEDVQSNKLFTLSENTRINGGGGGQETISVSLHRSYYNPFGSYASAGLPGLGLTAYFKNKDHYIAVNPKRRYWYPYRHCGGGCHNKKPNILATESRCWIPRYP